LPPTLDAWEQALPGRNAISPIFAGLYALDGPPRILHIIGYPDLERRRELRRTLYINKLWPPVGAPERIASARAEIAYPCALPAPVSPTSQK
jgi:hypothetical protein